MTKLLLVLLLAALFNGCASEADQLRAEADLVQAQALATVAVQAAAADRAAAHGTALTGWGVLFAGAGLFVLALAALTLVLRGHRRERSGPGALVQRSGYPSTQILPATHTEALAWIAAPEYEREPLR